MIHKFGSFYQRSVRRQPGKECAFAPRPQRRDVVTGKFYRVTVLLIVKPVWTIDYSGFDMIEAKACFVNRVFGINQRRATFFDIAVILRKYCCLVLFHSD